MTSTTISCPWGGRLVEVDSDDVAAGARGVERTTHHLVGQPRTTVVGTTLAPQYKDTSGHVMIVGFRRSVAAACHLCRQENPESQP
jgi:hypothetical protein